MSAIPAITRSVAVEPDPPAEMGAVRSIEPRATINRSDAPFRATWVNRDDSENDAEDPAKVAEHRLSGRRERPVRCLRLRDATAGENARSEGQFLLIDLRET